MPAIDLSNVIFRAFQHGDIPPPPQNIPNVAAVSTTPIVLDEVKFKAKQVGDID